MPFKDKEEYRRYMREYMRNYNKMKRIALKIVREHGDKIEKILGIKLPSTLKRSKKRRKPRRKRRKR